MCWVCPPQTELSSWSGHGDTGPIGGGEFEEAPKLSSQDGEEATAAAQE